LPPSMDLPKPQAEYQPEDAEIMSVANSAETPAAIATEKPGSSSPMPSPLTMNPPVTTPTDSSAPGSSGAIPPSGSVMPAIADDADLIEKEWVDKAKEIVAQTSHDPYLQNQEMNKVKADYLKKRYNKDLKTGND